MPPQQVDQVSSGISGGSDRSRDSAGFDRSEVAEPDNHKQEGNEQENVLYAPAALVEEAPASAPERKEIEFTQA